MGGGLKWQISKYWCTCGWEFHLWVAVPHMMYNRLFSRLDHPGGQWPGCCLLNGPFLEAYRLGSEYTPTVDGWKWQSVCLIFSPFRPSSFYLSLGPHLYTPVLFILKTQVRVFKFCHWYLCMWCSFVCPTAPASLYRYCGHSGALKPWKTNKYPLPEIPNLVTKWDFKSRKKKQELACSPPLFLQCN